MLLKTVCTLLFGLVWHAHASVSVRPLYAKSGFYSNRILPFLVTRSSNQNVGIDQVKLTGGTADCKTQVDPYRPHIFLIYCETSGTLEMYFTLEGDNTQYSYGPIEINALSVAVELTDEPPSSEENNNSSPTSTPTPTSTPNPAPTPTPAPTPNPTPAPSGAQLFSTNCFSCHNAVATDPRFNNINRNAIINAIASVPTMAAKNFNFSTAELDALVQYIGGQR